MRCQAREGTSATGMRQNGDRGGGRSAPPPQWGEFKVAQTLAAGQAHTGHCSSGSHAHGSLEGVGGLKTNEAYHSKADSLLIPEM